MRRFAYGVRPNSSPRERLAKLQALAARPGTEGEGEAAQVAIERLFAKYPSLKGRRERGSGAFSYVIDPRYNDLMFYFVGRPSDFDIRDLTDLLEAVGLAARGWSVEDPDYMMKRDRPFITDGLVRGARRWWYPSAPLSDPLAQLRDRGSVMFDVFGGPRMPGVVW